MMKNKEIFNKVVESPNTIIHSVFHLGSQIRSFPLSDFIYGQLDVMDFKFMFPEIEPRKIQKALKENKVVQFLIENGYYGWIAEVSFPHIIDKELHVHATDEHSSVFYAEDYSELIDNIIKQSQDYIEMDFEKIKENAKKED